MLRGGRAFRTAGVNVFGLVADDYPRPHLSTPEEIDALLDRALALGAGLVRSHTLGSPSAAGRGTSSPGCAPTGAWCTASRSGT